MATPQTDILYKRGARSISRRRQSANKGKSNLINTAVAAEAAQMINNTSIQAASRKNLLASKDEANFGSSRSKRQLLASDSKMSLGGRNSEQRHGRYAGKCNACHERKLEGHDHSVSKSLNRRL